MYTTIHTYLQFLDERKQQCFVSGHLSKPRTIKCAGIPQGPILAWSITFPNHSPNLYR